MKSIEMMSQIEVAAFVQTHLLQKGIEVVLSGGAAVSYYSKNQYVSKDLDLIRTGLTSRKTVAIALEEIGFIEIDRYFKHPLSEYFIEFPEGPLSVGKEPITSLKNIKLSTGTLRILSPTDCVKDRLASYFFFNDRQGLNQAIMVATTNMVDLDELERWSRVEEKWQEYNEIKGQLSRKKPTFHHEK